MPHLLCFGLGYSALATARRLAGMSWRISGTARSGEGVAAITAAGFTGFVFDGAGAGTGVSAALGDATHVLVSVPPGAAGDPVLVHLGSELGDARGIKAIVYLSTIGVYGDAGGSWVDETTPPNPQSERSRARLAAEQAWITFCRDKGYRLVILRLAGIYGPGRSAIDSLRAGTAKRIVKPGQVFNRIHVDDIAATAAAALGNPTARGIFNVADDEPSPSQDVIAHAAQLLGVAPPPEIAFADAQLSPMAASFYAENKRVRNHRLKTELGVALRYPTYRQGLAQILAGR